MRSSTFIIRLALRCLMLGLPAILAAQESSWRSAGAPMGGNVNALVRSARGNLYALTLNGTLFASADDGTTWRETTWPIAGRGISVIHAAPGGALFVFADGNRLFRSTDEGATWRTLAADLVLKPALVSDSSGALLGVTARGLVRSTDAGESWTYTDEEYTEYITGFAAGPGGIDYALRTVLYDLGRGFLKRSFDGGRTWAYMDTADSPLRYTGLAVSPRGTVFLGTTRDGVLRSTDRGETWWYVTGNDSADSYATGLTVLPDGEVVAMSGNTLLRSSDDGITWRRVPVSVVAGGVAIPTVAAASKGNGLLVGTADAGILRVGGPDDRWSIANNGLRGLGVQLLTVRRDGTLFAVSDGRLHRSTDGGMTWTDLFRDVAGWSYPPVITAEGALLVSLKAGDLEGILRSTDDGATWDSVATSLIVWRVMPAPDGRLYASTLNDGLYRSTDDGRSWSRFGPSADEMVPTAFHFDESGDILAGAYDGSIYRISRETGATALVQNTWSGRIRDIVETRGVLFAVTGSRGLYRSTDRGDTWEIYNTTSMQGIMLMLAAQPDGTLWGVTANGVIRSTDGGTEWMPANDGLPSTSVQTIEIGPDGRPWAGTAEGLYTMAAPAAVPADAGGEAVALSIGSLHPIPSAGRTVLDLRVGRSADVRCRLFDAAGREARVLFDRHLDAGAHTIELDLAGLPGGSYLLRLDAGGRSVTRMIPILDAPAK